MSKRKRQVVSKQIKPTEEQNLIQEEVILNGVNYNEEQNILTNNNEVETEQTENDLSTQVENKNFTDIFTDNILNYPRRTINKASLASPRRFKDILLREDLKLWKEAYETEISSPENVGQMEVAERPKNKEVIKLHSWENKL